MTAPKTNGRFNANSIVMAICTFIILGALAWVGRTAGNTHDSVIRLEANYEAIWKDITAVKTSMVTHTDLSVELLKLQVPERKTVVLPEPEKK
jgi:hypothetical protein